MFSSYVILLECLCLNRSRRYLVFREKYLFLIYFRRMVLVFRLGREDVIVGFEIGRLVSEDVMLYLGWKEFFSS